MGINFLTVVTNVNFLSAVRTQFAMSRQIVWILERTLKLNALGMLNLAGRIRIVLMTIKQASHLLTNNLVSDFEWNDTAGSSPKCYQFHCTNSILRQKISLIEQYYFFNGNISFSLIDHFNTKWVLHLATFCVQFHQCFRLQFLFSVNWDRVHHTQNRTSSCVGTLKTSGR